MAASSSSSFIRLRLLFDYPPPTTTGCRMCWLLVDLSACRVVADLESMIREKFGFSRRSVFHLFVEDCYLPHTESIYVVRDNDSVRVKVECVAQVNGLDSSQDTTKCKKRCRDSGEDGQGDDGARAKKKQRKKKERCEERMSESSKQVAAADEEKRMKRKKKKKMAENSCAAAPKPTAAPPELPVKVSLPGKIPKKPQEAPSKSQKPASSSSSSSSSDEDGAPTKTPCSTPAAPKPGSSSKPTQKIPASSSSTDSSSDETLTVKIPPKTRPPAPLATTSPKSQQAPSGGKNQSVNWTKNQSASVGELPCDKVIEPQNSDSEEEIQLVIRRPLQPARGRGAGRGWRGGPAERGRSVRGQRCFGSSCDGDMEPSYRTDSLTNKSMVLQNGGDGAPKQDYSSLPLLAAPPPVGQKIAFKLLELTENYTPEVSDYKEGKILSFDPTSKQIELELLSTSQAPVEPGKFDLVYQNPDGSERVEYAVSRGCWVTERWESLLEPRLIL
ncbi:coilin [Melanotaenia boesemani]|uniref:coilin n=1 Tax=Melanotaenia boesemani TaxID=1250792 RepID=UPI001C052F28|nr:coilin [Melanotaenia boesemani]